MKVLFLSDIHANHIGLLTILKSIDKPDMILCAGDITGYYPFVNEVITIIKKEKIISVRGNHDDYLINEKTPVGKSATVNSSVEFTKNIISAENFNYIKSLPVSLKLSIGGKEILIFHGSPWNPLEERVYLDYPHFEKFMGIKANIILLGHTHYPLIKTLGHLTLINPGSCGQPRDYNLLSYVVWDTISNTFTNKRIRWDIDTFIQKAKKYGVKEKLFGYFRRI